MIDEVLLLLRLRILGLPLTATTAYKKINCWSEIKKALHASTSQFSSVVLPQCSICISETTKLRQKNENFLKTAKPVT